MISFLHLVLREICSIYNKIMKIQSVAIIRTTHTKAQKVKNNNRYNTTQKYKNNEQEKLH